MDTIRKNEENYFITSDRQERLKILSLEDFALFVKQFRIGDSVNVYLNIDRENKTASEFIGVKLSTWNEETFYQLGGYNYGICTIQGLNEPDFDKEFVSNVKKAITYFVNTETVGVMLNPGDSWKEVWVYDELVNSFEKENTYLAFEHEDIDTIEAYLLKHNCCLLPITDINGNRSSSQERCDVFREDLPCILCDRISLKSIRPALDKPIIATGQTSEEYQLEKLRKKLICIISRAVEKNEMCIGTFYKNIGKHHCQDNIEEEYDNGIIVNLRSYDFSTYGGYNAAHVYDLYKDTVTFQLMCSLNGESGDDYDMPIEAVCLEGLLEIVKWLKKFGFLSASEFEPMVPILYCAECGSSNVETQAWVKPNTGNDFVDDVGDQKDSGNNWCHECENHTRLWSHEDLFAEMKGWFVHLTCEALEEITGNKFAGNYDEFRVVCMKYWEALSEEQQVALWNTRDKDE